MWYEDYARSKMHANDGSHDIYHAQRVAHNVKHIMKPVDPMLQCALACAWLHDVCDKKYTDTENEIRSIKRFCRRVKFPEIDILENVIKNISFTKLRNEGPPSLASSNMFDVWNIVSQSDMIEALGITGMIRTLMYQGYINNNIEEAFSYARNHLLKCIDYITIKEFKEEATRRTFVMSQWLSNLDNDVIYSISKVFFQFGKEKKSFDDAITFLKNETSDEAQMFYSVFSEEVRFSAEAC